MRKRIISRVQQQNSPSNQNWLDLEKLAEVEISSEDARYPIESALLPGSHQGWRAAESGKQTIRLLFKKPLQLHCIHLAFLEPIVKRTQEYALCWSPDNGVTFDEIVRQQWNFIPEGSISEKEDHFVRLTGVTIIELNITPDISDQTAFASLEQLWIA